MAGLRRHNSGLTNDDSTGFADQEETSSLDSIEWTNEKHSIYLKSMEASFIDQLYNSKDLFSWCPPEDQGLDVKLCNQGSPPGQSKAHQHSYWPENLYRTALQTEGVDGYGTFPANPYTHFRATDNDAFEVNISRMLVDGEHHQVSLRFNEEVSDQNFINKDCENRGASGQRAKRLRNMDTSATSSNDQVVPFGISHFSMQDHRYEGNRNRAISECTSNFGI